MNCAASMLETHWKGRILLVPQNDRERNLVLGVLKSIVVVLERMLGPDVELVAHDLHVPEHSVVAIANGKISGRTIGSAIFTGPFGDLGLQKLIQGEDDPEPVTVVDDYKTRAADGRELHSLSLLFRDVDGVAFAALCANSDRSRLQQLKELLNDMFFQDAPSKAPEEPPSVEEMAIRIIEESVASVSPGGTQLTKDERIAAVKSMQERGLFIIRSSVDIAAKRLGVTRHTIYNYLDQS